MSIMKAYKPRLVLILSSLLTVFLFLTAAYGASNNIHDLSWCIKTALSRNLNIKEQRLAVRSSKQQVLIQLKNMLPTLSTRYSYTGMRDVGSISIMGDSIPISSHDNYDWQLVLTQPIFEGGALWNNYKAAKLGEKIAKLELKSKRNDLIRKVKDAYFQMLVTQKILLERKAAVRRLVSHLADARSLFQVGLIAKNDLLQSQVSLAEARQDEISAQHDVQLARAKLNLLLRQPLETPINIKDILSAMPVKVSLRDARSYAWTHRPEIKAAKAAIKRAERLLKVSEAGYWPKINLTGVYEEKGITPDVSNNPYGDHESAQISAVATWTIWAWNKTGNQCAQASSALAQARIQLKSLRDSVSLEVEQAYLRMEEAANAIKVARASLEQAKENFDINQAKFREKLVSNTDVLDAQTLLVNARTRYFNALANFHMAVAAMEYAVSGNLSSISN